MTVHRCCQSCRSPQCKGPSELQTGTDMKTRFSQKQRGSSIGEYSCQPDVLQDTHCYCTLECIMDDRPPYLSGCWCTFRGSVLLFWVWRTTWHPWVRTHCHSCLLVQTSCVSFRSAAQTDLGASHSQHTLYCYAWACFNRHGWKATLWIFTFPQMRPRGRRGKGREVFPPWGLCFYPNETVWHLSLSDSFQW